jgi:hypothetical protein
MKTPPAEVKPVFEQRLREVFHERHAVESCLG